MLKMKQYCVMLLGVDFVQQIIYVLNVLMNFGHTLKMENVFAPFQIPKNLTHKVFVQIAWLMAVLPALPTMNINVLDVKISQHMLKEVSVFVKVIKKWMQMENVQSVKF